MIPLDGSNSNMLGAPSGMLSFAKTPGGQLARARATFPRIERSKPKTDDLFV